MSDESPAVVDMKTTSGQSPVAVFCRNPQNLFASIHKQWGLLPGNQGLNNISQATQTVGNAGTPLENVRKEAVVIAQYVVTNFGNKDEKKSPDRYCKTMRKTVYEVSERHDIALKSMVNKLNLEKANTFTTFVNVADEIFEDGQINWGRVIVVYAFAGRLADHFKDIPDYADKISLYVGKYVGNKLGHWILDNGGWDAFDDFFYDPNAIEDQSWKGVIITATLGLGGIGALAMLAR